MLVSLRTRTTKKSYALFQQPCAFFRTQPPDFSKDKVPVETEYEKREWYGAHKDWSPTIKDVKDKNKIQFWKGPPKLGWHDRPKRCGLIAMKIGMLNEWDIYGSRKALTVMKVEDCKVVQVKTEEKEGINSIQVGGGPVKTKKVSFTLKGHFEKAGVEFKAKLAEFRVAPEGLLPVGTELTCRHFVPGQYVDVQGKTIGKGFQGVMKRWGFKGQPASHGVSKAHRSAGSTGSINAGRVFKGKKMAGRMGNKTKTIQNLVVHKIDVERNLIYLDGAVPGNKGETVRIRDSLKKRGFLYNGEECILPFPTYFPESDEATDEGPVLYAPVPKKNCLDVSRSLDPKTKIVRPPGSERDTGFVVKPGEYDS